MCSTFAIWHAIQVKMKKNIVPINKTYAAIDIGSNTVQLLLAECDESGKIVGRRNYLCTTKLGDCAEDRSLTETAMNATAEAVAGFCEKIKAAGTRGTRILATSAVRDAANRQVLLDKLAQVTDIKTEILTGEEEAMLAYAGACSSLSVGSGVPVIDSGGSSTEMICALPEGPIIATSMNVGAVRAHRGSWSDDEIYAKLAEGIGDCCTKKEIIGVGGTITTIAGVIAGIQKYDRSVVEGMVLLPSQLEKLLEQLEPLSIAERCAFSPLLARRGEIIREGLVIWRSLMKILHSEKIVVCGGGILDGAIQSML